MPPPLPPLPPFHHLKQNLALGYVTKSLIPLTLAPTPLETSNVLQVLNLKFIPTNFRLFDGILTKCGLKIFPKFSHLESP